jgi:aminopeptidase C
LTIEQQQQQIKEARGGETFSESAVAPDCYRSRAIFPFFRDMLVNHVGEFDNIELSLNYLYFFKKQKQKNPFLARFQHRRHNNQVHSEVF